MKLNRSGKNCEKMYNVDIFSCLEKEVPCSNKKGKDFKLILIPVPYPMIYNPDRIQSSTLLEPPLGPWEKVFK